ncbi:MAG: YdcF family protein [Proteobacteria bacterium]|nr:YdcF family protein [Pseudomonadota bacterium]
MLNAVGKIFWFVTQPSSLVALVVGWALLVAIRRPAGRGWRPAIFAVVLLLVTGLSPLASGLMLLLETRFPPPVIEAARSDYAGIIVLGGAEESPVTVAPAQTQLNEAAERITEGALLARKLPSAKLVFSGGNGAVVSHERPGAPSIAEFWRQVGIPADRIAFEDKSRNTYENALYCLVLLKPKPGDRWLLVTSAYHMPRAMGVYRRAGFDVTAYPVDFRVAGHGDTLLPFGSLPAGLKRLDETAKEWVGLVSYRLLGRTDALFPAP